MLCVLIGVIGYSVYYFNSEIMRKTPFRQPVSKEDLAEMMLGYWQVALVGGKKQYTVGSGDILAFRRIGSERPGWGRHELIRPIWATILGIFGLEESDGTRQAWRAVDGRHIEIEKTGSFFLLSRRKMYVYVYEVSFNADGKQSTWTPVPERSEYRSPFEIGRRRFREEHREIQCIYLGRFKKGGEYFNEARIEKGSFE